MFFVGFEFLQSLSLRHLFFVNRFGFLEVEDLFGEIVANGLTEKGEDSSDSHSSYFSVTVAIVFIGFESFAFFLYIRTLVEQFNAFSSSFFKS